MDSALSTAARALSVADPLNALQQVALRSDAPALALRGIAMAQLGELGRARALLRRAARGFGDAEPLARARCVVAKAEVALALRDLAGAQKGLDEAAALLTARGDIANATFARLVQVRRWVLLGELQRAKRALAQVTSVNAPPRLTTLVQLAAADLAMRLVDGAQAARCLQEAREAAGRTCVPPLLGEIEAAEKRLREPIARAVEASHQRFVTLDDLPRVWSSGKLVVDACRREVRLGKDVVALVTRPVLCDLLVSLAEATPGDAARDALITRVFGARRINDSHRVRLRVELGRLRRLLAGLAAVRATKSGYELAPRGKAGCVILLPPGDGEGSAVLALLRGGEAWGTAGLAAALGKSQRAVQRALAELEQQGRVQSVGAGRARRWLGTPSVGFATTLLLVAPETVG